MPTDSILSYIRRLGYVVSIHRVNGTVEMHAVNWAAPKPDSPMR